MTPELHPVLLANLAGLSSEERHQVIQRRLPEIKAYAMHLMESGGRAFSIVEEGRELEVDHEFIIAEFQALVDVGYDITGRYQGIMLPHEAAATAVEYLRRERGSTESPAS